MQVPEYYSFLFQNAKLSELNVFWWKNYIKKSEMTCEKV